MSNIGLGFGGGGKYIKMPLCFKRCVAIKIAVLIRVPYADMIGFCKLDNIAQTVIIWLIESNAVTGTQSRIL